LLLGAKLSLVARMEPQGRKRPSSTGYGAIRERRCRTARLFPDFAALHPGDGVPILRREVSAAPGISGHRAS
jgi:hypothetical protein